MKNVVPEQESSEASSSFSHALTQVIGGEVNGWHVEQACDRSHDHSGGHFSRGFIVRRNGHVAFMKVLDMEGAMRDDDPETLMRLSRSHDFESILLRYCSEQRMSNVVQYIESGKFDLNTDGVRHTMFYLIMERGDADVRAEFNEIDSRLSKRFFALHQIAVGLSQLHGKQIAHMDVKPSNVLQFFDQELMKLCDLGCSISRQHPGPGDNVSFPGDLRYAPPEYIYEFTPRDAVDRRQGSDAYMLGSMISFLFLGMGATTLLINATPDEAVPLEGGPGVMFEDALPFLISAHSRITKQLRDSLPSYCAAELSTAYSQLCHPSPRERGHPAARQSVGRLPGVDRYVSLFQMLRMRAEVAERIGVKKC